MSIKSYLSIGVASFSILMGATATQAAELAPGKLSIVLDTGIFFSSNIIDFSPVQNGDRSLGTPGIFSVTTSEFDLESDIFADDSLGTPPPVRTFLASEGLINDLTFPKAVADSLPGGGIQDGITYDIPEFALLDFDTDSDGSFGEADDFQYFITGLTRNVSESTTGGFNVAFDFDGFFRDNKGDFADTPSVISLFNGTTGNIDPRTFENIALADFAAGSGTDTGAVNNVGFTASFDATITTVEDGVSTPEPMAIMGLLGVVGLASGLRNKKKA